MPEEEEGIPPHSRLQGVLKYLTILAAAIAGMAHAPPWIAVPTGRQRRSPSPAFHCARTRPLSSFSLFVPVI
jgi:hypothetical protein